MGAIKANILVKHLLDGIPPTVAFSSEQIEALKEGITRLSSKRHGVDIRLSALGFYLILLGGTERRSQKRLAEERAAKPFLTLANLTVFVLLSLLLWFAGIGAVCQIDKLLMSV